MAAAAQFYQSIVGFVLVILFNWIVRRIERADEPLSLF
jgi:ABC-type polysaccharide transport system permease subunit